MDGAQPGTLKSLFELFRQTVIVVNFVPK